MKDHYQIIKRPLITEKANRLKELANQITLEVSREANKIEIRQAVEHVFKVKVTNVHTMIMGGKKRRVGKSMGQRPDWKKAIMTLAPGQKIDFFEGV
ncbi:MAG: 50S ribosomal protein L23 [Deltaproteobacteria bacterium]|nr:50S ribosomal protein L23 [Deltaproteobacteria bacterium]